MCFIFGGLFLLSVAVFAPLFCFTIPQEKRKTFFDAALAILRRFRGCKSRAHLVTLRPKISNDLLLPCSRRFLPHFSPEKAKNITHVKTTPGYRRRGKNITFTGPRINLFNSLRAIATKAESYWRSDPPTKEKRNETSKILFANYLFRN